MASVVISSRSGGGQLRSGDGATTTETYYCFDCDRNLTIIATSDSGVICPICGHVVLEEFETPSSPPPPPPPPLPPLPPPPPRSTTFIDPHSFFPTSDTDSDVELSEPLRPPPPPVPCFFLPTVSTSGIMSEIRRQVHPPPPSSSSRSAWDWEFASDRLGYPWSPSPPPPPLPSGSVIDRRRPPCPEFPTPSAPPMADFFLSLPEEDFSEVHTLQPPLPPPSPPEHLLLSPPRSPSASSEVSEPFYSPEREPPNQPPPPTIPDWNYFFPGFEELELNTSNHQRPSELQPPIPPPWLQSPSMEVLLDMRLTKDLVSEWECHQCSICIDNFELNQKVKLTPCNHLYHSDCLLRWLDLHKSCPVCRSKLPSH